MHLVPDHVGGWKRHSLKRAAHEVDGSAPARVEAEFRRGDRQAAMLVSASDGGMAPAAAVDRHDDQGSEKIYAEGGSTVRETVRRIDGRTEVAVMRPDGVTVIVQAHRVPAADLKQLAFGVHAAAR
jgi:hypothetical protein